MCWFAYGCGIQAVHTAFCKCAVIPVTVTLLRLSRRLTRNVGFRQWKHIRAGNCSDIWLTKLYIHQVNWRMESTSSTSGETKPQKEKHCCLIRTRHESCGLQLQLSAKYKDALAYMVYMTYMIYISMSLPHLSYLSLFAPKWQKHKSNQIHIRSDWVAALVLSSRWDPGLVLLLDAYWR